jgi:hypothetical protein
MKIYFWNLLISIDQLVNTIFAGNPDETISSRVGKKIKSKTASKFDKLLCKFLDLFEKNHCIKSIEDDEE